MWRDCADKCLGANSPRGAVTPAYQPLRARYGPEGYLSADGPKLSARLAIKAVETHKRTKRHVRHMRSGLSQAVRATRSSLSMGV